MADISDAEIEAVARAMCAARGDTTFDLWPTYAGVARMEIATYRAVMALGLPSGAPVTVWTDYGTEGWHPTEFPTLKEALLSRDRHSSPFRITRNVDFEPVEKA